MWGLYNSLKVQETGQLTDHLLMKGCQYCKSVVKYGNPRLNALMFYFSFLKRKSLMATNFREILSKRKFVGKKSFKKEIFSHN